MAVVELSAITVDCREIGPMIAFYAGAFGGEVSHEDGTGAWVHVPGGPLILVRRVEAYEPPSWPGTGMQMHLELTVDDLDAAEARLIELGASSPEFQPHRAEGNVVMLDPAGHPFCIGTRV